MLVSVQEEFQFKWDPRDIFLEIAGRVFAMLENFNPTDLQTPISPIYVVYRFFHFSWYIITYAINYGCYDVSWVFYPIYLTHQTLFLQAAYSTLYVLYIFWKLWSTALITPDRGRESPESITFNVENNRLPFITKIIWTLMNIIYTVPYLISLMYWIFLHDDEEAAKWETCKVTRNHVIHTFNSVASIIDSIIVSVPVKFTHSLFPILYALWYSSFALTYELVGGPFPGNDTSVYPILYWKNPNGPSTALKTTFGCMTGCFILFTFLCWGTYPLKSLITGCMKIGPLKLTRPPPQVFIEDL